MSAATAPAGHRRAALELAARAHQVSRLRDPWWAVLPRVRRARRGPEPVVRLSAPWQDTPSPERAGWRERAAALHGETVCALDYLVCWRCRAGWVAAPYTDPHYRRCGLASAALAALRAEHPGLTWHTPPGRPGACCAFWRSAGQGVRGGYGRREPCGHAGAEPAR